MTTSTAENDTVQPWVPFGLDEDEVVTHTALREDIPDWLATSLWNWIRLQFTSMNQQREPIVYSESFRECERILRVRIPWNGGATTYIKVPLDALRTAYAGKSDLDVWRLVDYCLAHRSSYTDRLQKILVEAGSAWEVGTRSGKPGLVKRMPDGVADAARAAFLYGDAGRRLASAWESAFGVDPNPELAYSRAVKAVEDASIPVVSPKHTTATLGTVISAIRDSGKYSLPNLREHKDANTHDVLLSMLQMLWTGQHDRHGGLSAMPVPNVTQEEAEAAVMLAVTLVGWFETGKVQK